MSAALPISRFNAEALSIAARYDALQAHVRALAVADAAYRRALEAHADAVMLHRLAIARGVLTVTHGHRLEAAEQALADARLSRDVAVAALLEVR